MTTPRILAFAGSLRKDSFNKKLVKIAAQAAEAEGAEVQIIDLADFPLPLFDEDLEKSAGPPANATKLKELMKAANGFLLACPEYNSSITAVLKNAIDWASRPAPNEPSLAAFTGKAAVLMAASPGALGGLRGLVTVRSILGNIGVVVLPDQMAIMQAHDAFGADGRLKFDKQQAGIENLGRKLTAFLKKHVG